MKSNAERFTVILAFLFVCAFGAAFAPASASAEESCGCPKLGCDPCSINKGTTFYSAKCGPNDSKVKSCARPTCVPIPDPTAACPHPPSADSGPREPIVVSKQGGTKEEAAEATSAAEAAGHVKVMSGTVSIVDAKGHKNIVKGEAEIHEGDHIESSADGAALVKLQGGNKIHVLQDTSLELKEHKTPEVEASRKTLLHLIKGKIRNQVEQKYNGQASYYRVTTAGAVAGVRGTDFVVETHMDGGHLETKIATIKGDVTFGKAGTADFIDVKRGEGASYKAELGNAKEGDANWDKVVVAGTFSPVFKISDAGIRDLDRDSRAELAMGRKAARRDSAICTKPKGLFNQCVWKCEGNPAGESKCRGDLPSVSCTRLRCNGNGQWADESQLSPSAAQAQCPAHGEMVKDCDY
jgi:hypothetical protein